MNVYKILAAVFLALVALAVPMAAASPAQASGPSLCTPPVFGSASVSGGREVMLTNEFNSSSVMCMNNDGLGTDFTITQADMSDTLPVDAYPSLIKGCHWGTCSTSTYNYFPQKISTISPGDYTYGATVGIVPGSYIGDFAWDIWINQDSTAGQPGQICNSCGTSDELMVWLKYSSTQPRGSLAASNVSIGGTSYDIWRWTSGTASTTTYVMHNQNTQLNFDPKKIIADMINRSYTTASYYVIDAEFGLEIKTLHVQPPSTTNQAGVVMSVCNNLTGSC